MPFRRPVTMSKELKVIKTTDGRFAICDRTELGNGWRIWSPVSTERWDTELAAKIALINYRAYGIPTNPGPTKPTAKPEPKPEPKPRPKIHTHTREDFRIVKLSKGVFAVELQRFGKWEQVAEKKTYAKAEKFIIKQCYGTD